MWTTQPLQPESGLEVQLGLPALELELELEPAPGPALELELKPGPALELELLALALEPEPAPLARTPTLQQQPQPRPQRPSPAQRRRSQSPQLFKPVRRLWAHCSPKPSPALQLHCLGFGRCPTPRVFQCPCRGRMFCTHRAHVFNFPPPSPVFPQHRRRRFACLLESLLQGLSTRGPAAVEPGAAASRTASPVPEHPPQARRGKELSAGIRKTVPSTKHRRRGAQNITRGAH